MKVSAIAIYSPLLILYAIGPIIHDVIPNLSLLGFVRVGYFTLFYLASLIAFIPILLYIKRVESKKINFTLGISLRLAIGLGVYLVPYILFWSDWPLFHISLLISLYVSFLSMVAFRTGLSKQSLLLKDSATGSYYRIVNGKAHLLTEGQDDRIKACNNAQFGAVQDFNSNALENYERKSVESFVGNHSTTYGSTDTNDGFAINPASGMPMIGGMSGLDVHGNSWGTNFNEPSNTYDPNRGY